MANVKKDVLRKLAGQIRGLEQGGLADKASSFITSTRPEMDALLPGRGLPLGGLIEILADEAGGAFSLSLTFAQKAIESKAAWAVVDVDSSFYPPAAAQLGLDIGKLFIVRCQPRQAAWAFNQLLRCPDISASFLSAHSLGRSLDNMAYRRLQLAAERGQGLGFVLRPTQAARRPCWAALRLQVESAKRNEINLRRSVRIKVLHARGAHGRSGCGESIVMELSDATFSVPVSTALAAAAPAV